MNTLYNFLCQQSHVSTNKKLYKQLLLLSFITAMAFACGKTTSSSAVQPGVVKSYYGFPQNNVDGVFLFQSNINNNPTIKKIAHIIGLFYDKNGKVIAGAAHASIGIYQLVADSLEYQSINLSTDSLFGIDLAFSLTPPRNTATAPVTANFYSPTAIYITNNSIVPGQINLSSGSSLPITWNADLRNNKGVNIYAEFLPTLSPNDSLYNAGYKNEINNSVMVPDNGAMFCLPSFFSKFPKGANVMLICRAWQCNDCSERELSLFIRGLY